jgi:fatty-acyl-CoA synthase
LSTSSSDRLTRRDELLWDRWSHWATQHGDREAVVHWVAGQDPVRWTWRELAAEALRFAGLLREAGVRPGDVCALIIRHHPKFHALYLGVSALGAIPAVLAYPNPRIHPDKFVQGVAGMARRSGLDWILTEAELEPIVGPLTRISGSTVRGLLFPLEWKGVASEPMTVAASPSLARGADTECLLQHSSGTTGLQKAVMLSHRAVLDHVASYGAALQLRETDRIVSWLPLYHDMGMIAAFHVPLAMGIPVVQLDPFEWITMPQLLLEAISRESGTLCWLPNFAYNLLADRIHEEELEGTRLDSMRMFINCSEPVRADSHSRFVARFAQYGLRPESVAACYAMAETTFAATQTSAGEPARSFVADRAALTRGDVVAAAPGAAARTCVSSGRPIPGCEVTVLGETGELLGAGKVGELVIRSTTMFEGYRNNPEDTAKVLRSGQYFSGDLGFELDGEIFVIGRKKDLIIVAGKNLYPEDIEDAVGQVPGVTPGRVVAVGLEDEAAGTEQICVIAETDVTGPAEQKKLRLAIQVAGMQIDVTIARVYLAPPRWLIKSSSGKPSRNAHRQRILDGELSPK